MIPVRFILVMIFIFLWGCAIAQNSNDTTKIIPGKTYLFVESNGHKYYGTVMNSSEKNIVINAKKIGIVNVSRDNLAKVEEVSKRAMRNVHSVAGRGEVCIGYGIKSPYIIRNTTLSNKQSIVTLSYRYQLNRVFIGGIGFCLDKQSGSQTYRTIHNYSYDYKYGIKSMVLNITIAPEIVCNYYLQDDHELNLNLKLYGLCGLGVVYSKDEKDTTGTNTISSIGDFYHGTNKKSFGFSYHVSPIGIRIGRLFSGYIELGYGYKGIVNCGIDIRFRDRVKVQPDNDYSKKKQE